MKSEASTRMYSSTKAFKKHLETGRSWDGCCCMLLLLLLEPCVLATTHGRNRLNSQPEGWILKIQGRHADEGKAWKKASEWHAKKVRWTHPVRLESTPITNPLL